jgi:aromatic ring-opening dioxygenase catalytic subunit (LigB family)
MEFQRSLPFDSFPAHYYDMQYPNTGAKDLAEKIIGMLQSAGIKAEGVRRGLDHGGKVNSDHMWSIHG